MPQRQAGLLLLGLIIQLQFCLSLGQLAVLLEHQALLLIVCFRCPMETPVVHMLQLDNMVLLLSHVVLLLGQPIWRVMDMVFKL